MFEDIAHNIRQYLVSSGGKLNLWLMRYPNIYFLLSHRVGQCYKH